MLVRKFDGSFVRARLTDRPRLQLHALVTIVVHTEHICQHPELRLTSCSSYLSFSAIRSKSSPPLTTSVMR